MKRVAFLIDGFNLYHSIIDAHDFLGLRVKWLDISSFCRAYIPLFGKEASLSEIHYFSAYAFHKNDAGVIKRHETYIQCLKSAGIYTHLGRFKARSTQCPLTGQMQALNSGISCPINGHFLRHDEKETDVAIAVKLCELVLKNKAEIVVLVTGDTDLAPAFRLCNEYSPQTTILFAFPYRRFNNELKELAPKSFLISTDAYKRHQFPNPVIMGDGTQLFKPVTW